MTAERIISADEAVPRAAMAHVASVAGRFMGKPLDRDALRWLDEEIRDAVRFVRVTMAARFPDLVAIALPRFDYVHLVRADLEHAGIQRLALELARGFPGITGVEIAEAVRRAFPKYDPSHAPHSIDHVDAARAKAAERREAVDAVPVVPV